MVFVLKSKSRELYVAAVKPLAWTEELRYALRFPTAEKATSARPAGMANVMRIQ